MLLVIYLSVPVDETLHSIQLKVGFLKCFQRKRPFHGEECIQSVHASICSCVRTQLLTSAARLRGKGSEFHSFFDTRKLKKIKTVRKR